MPRFIEGEDRSQAALFPERLDDYVADDNPVRLVEAFVDGRDLKKLGFEGVEPRATGRPAYHPSVLLKLYIYGYLNRICSSRSLEPGMCSRDARKNSRSSRPKSQAPARARTKPIAAASRLPPGRPPLH